MYTFCSQFLQVNVLMDKRTIWFLRTFGSYQHWNWISCFNSWIILSSLRFCKQYFVFLSQIAETKTLYYSVQWTKFSVSIHGYFLCTLILFANSVNWPIGFIICDTELLDKQVEVKHGVLWYREYPRKLTNNLVH